MDKSAAAGFQNFVQIHDEAEGHDGALEKSARNSAAFVDVRMRKAETKENSNGESDGRGKQSRERKCETKNKNNFRERRHRLGREYQAGRRMGQQEGEKTLRRCRPSAVAKFQQASFFFLFGRSSGNSGGVCFFRGGGLFERGGRAGG